MLLVKVGANHFFSFHLWGVIVINNVSIAFIINAFFQLLKILNDRQGWEERIQGEARIKGNKGMFDASNITGTLTSQTCSALKLPLGGFREEVLSRALVSYESQ
jgi:hypothetical protein